MCGSSLLDWSVTRGCALVVREAISVILEADNVLNVLDLALEESCAIIEVVGIRLSASNLFEDLAYAGHY